MFVPIGTDAPLYYRPVATIGLIVANFAAFAATRGGYAPDGWLLRFGEGIHPLEWIASAFLHFGIWHLLGNMLFLWTFGLIVEGKLGWWRFLLLYLGMTAVESAVSQVLMLGYSGPASGAGGASGVIFGLMAIALLWAPKNCIDVAFFWSPFGLVAARFGTLEVTVLTFSLLYIGMNVVFGSLRGFEIGSEVLHLLGAVIGAVAGAVLLRLRWVDCENWDLMTLVKSGSFSGPALPPPRKPTSDHPPPINRTSPRQRLRRVCDAIDRGQFLAASADYQALKAEAAELQLDEPRLRRLIAGLQADSDWVTVTPLLQEYIDLFPRKDAHARMVLAGILVKQEQRPRAALKILDGLAPERIPADQQAYVESVRAAAEAQIAAGILELSVGNARDVPPDAADVSA